MIVINLKQDDVISIHDLVFVKLGDKKGNIVIEAPKEIEVKRVKEHDCDVFRCRDNGPGRD